MSDEYTELQRVINERIDALHAKMPGYSREVAAQWWRLNNLYWIEDENGRKVKFRATPIQTRFFFRLHRRNVVPKARQVRISTLCLLMALDHCLFGQNKTAGIIDLTDEDAKRKLARIRFAYDHLDDPDDPATAALGRMVKLTAPKILDNAHEMGFANETRIWASTSLRGGTITFLWVTEFGPIASDFPEKAEKIKTGALNTIHKEVTAIIESTYKGGRGGPFYDMIRLAQASPARPNVMQWRLHFFGWQDEATYRAPVDGPFIVPGKYVKYFEELEAAWGQKLTIEQKHWYVLKAEEQGDAMSVEFPGTVEEALRGRVEGSIYGDIMTPLRSQGRVCEFVADSVAPLITSWDLGDTDYTCVWLLQAVGFDFLALDYHCGHNMTPAQHVRAMQEWERRYDKTIMRHFMPHDGDHKHAGTSWITQFREAGLRDMVLVPRIPRLWDGINALRAILPRFRFHVRCDKDIERGEYRYPSGIGALEAYRKQIVEVGKRTQEEPVHDEYSHGASALRTIAEAHMRKMLVNIPALSGEQRTARREQVGQAITGLREPDPVKAHQAQRRQLFRPPVLR